MPRIDTGWFERNYGLRIRIGSTGAFQGRRFRVTAQSGPHVQGRYLDDGSKTGPMHPTWEMQWDEDVQRGE